MSFRFRSKCTYVPLLAAGHTGLRPPRRQEVLRDRHVCVSRCPPSRRRAGTGADHQPHLPDSGCCTGTSPGARGLRRNTSVTSVLTAPDDGRSRVMREPTGHTRRSNERLRASGTGITGSRVSLGHLSYPSDSVIGVHFRVSECRCHQGTIATTVTRVSQGPRMARCPVGGATGA